MSATKDRKRVHEVLSVEYHRNGMSGSGFHVVRFIHEVNASKGISKLMVAIVFEQEGHVAVLSARSAMAGMMNDCWRGDHFEAELRKVIADWRKKTYEV